jgi:small subunit ribosomal protein S8
MVGDKISNLIISLKNASMIEKETVTVSGYKLYASILEVLQKKGFIDSFKADKRSGDIVVTLKYDENDVPAINDVKRVSKLSKRVYRGSKEIFPVKNGYGTLVVSTPNGVISDDEARKQNVGGELLFQIW